MRKRFLIAILLFVPSLTFMGCGEDDNNPMSEVPEQPGDNDDGNGEGEDDYNGGNVLGDPVIPGDCKTLIAYFSRWGNTDYPADVDASTGASVIIRNGNKYGTTEVVAQYVQSAIGGDIHLIETTNRYPVEFDDVRDLNHAELAAGTLPALKNRIENIDDYETVFIGYPIWAVDVPQAIKTFLAAYDMRGKKVIPFCTHDGYGAGRSFTTVKNAATGAMTLDGMALLASDVPSAESRVTEWLKTIGFGSDRTSNAVTVTAGGNTFEAEWLDTPLAKEIRAMFPLKATLDKYGGREYYGSMPARPENTEEGQLTFHNGDITYCPANNTIAIFYAKADDPQMGNLTMRITHIGRVTSSLDAFDCMASHLEFTFNDK